MNEIQKFVEKSLSEGNPEILSEILEKFSGKLHSQMHDYNSQFEKGFLKSDKLMAVYGFGFHIMILVLRGLSEVEEGKDFKEVPYLKMWKDIDFYGITSNDIREINNS